MFASVIDFVYGTDETLLVRSAKALGLGVVDGLELLVSQGALSFELFTGLPAPLEEMRAAARRR
jgi:shikimate 5-dehydrogenase